MYAIILFYMILITMFGILIKMGLNEYREYKESKKRWELRRRKAEFNRIMNQTNLRA